MKTPTFITKHLTKKINQWGLVLTLIILAFVFYAAYHLTFQTLTNQLVQQQIELAKNQADLVARILATQLSDGTPQSKVQSDLQKSIQNFSTDDSFICMFDQNGQEICHPNPKKVGRILSENNSVIRSGSNFQLEKKFKKALLKGHPTGGMRQMSKKTEIVYLSPVPHTNWMVASHLNIEKYQYLLQTWQKKLIAIFLMIWLTTVIITFVFLNRQNQNKIHQIVSQNQKLFETYFKQYEFLESSPSNEKRFIKRLLVQKGTHLAPLSLDNIAYIYTQNRMTYLIESGGEASKVNFSLDELMKILPPETFFRVSRQVILSADAIEKIIKYGNTQLKVIVKPKSPFSIIVSKNKLPAFKQWLGKH